MFPAGWGATALGWLDRFSMEAQPAFNTFCLHQPAPAAWTWHLGQLPGTSLLSPGPTLEALGLPLCLWQLLLRAGLGLISNLKAPLLWDLTWTGYL